MRAPLMEGLEGRQFLSATPMLAGTPKGPGAGAAVVQQRDQDRLRDGSCQTSTGTVSASTAATVTQDQIHLRLRDGSCKA